MCLFCLQVPSAAAAVPARLAIEQSDGQSHIFPATCVSFVSLFEEFGEWVFCYIALAYYTILPRVTSEKRIHLNSSLYHLRNADEILA